MILSFAATNPTMLHQSKGVNEFSSRLVAFTFSTGLFVSYMPAYWMIVHNILRVSLSQFMVMAELHVGVLQKVI